MFVLFPMNVKLLNHFRIYPSNLNAVLIIYIIYVSDEFETGALDLDNQDQIGLQTLTVLKKLNCFSLHLQT